MLFRSVGTLVILRHGESTWNQQNLFTGWHDVPLSDKGRTEAAAAGRTMAEAGIFFDQAHTSLLERAVVTCHLALEAMGHTVAIRDLNSGLHAIAIDYTRRGRVLSAGESSVLGQWVAVALIDLALAVPGLPGFRVGERSGRSLSPPVLNNRSLHVSPQRHTWADREAAALPPLVA